jgi:hypothetical protein
MAPRYPQVNDLLNDAEGGETVSKKELAALAGFVLLVWHGLSLLADAERCKRNLARYNAAPTVPNLVKLLAAEGALIGDLRWL